MSTSRLSYASSPESDLELSPGPSTSLSLGNLPQLVKSSSDPSIATNQDNLERDREIIGDGLPPPYTHQFDQNRKYGYPTGTPSQTATHDNSTSRPQSLYGINAPDLPPRIDRGSKPPPGSGGPSGTPSRNSSSGGTIGRSAQERLFGKSSSTEDNQQDEYVTSRKPNTDSLERSQTQPPTQNSLDRQRALANSTYQGSPAKPGAATATQNGSYDSVSSYDSYSTSQNMRLGPNAPDDLKSVPNANGRLPPANNPEYRTVHHEHHSRSFVGSNDLNRQNSPGRPQYHDLNSTRNIDPRNSSLHPQRPSNLMLDNSPRKPVLETKTDYGKYSRNNSATQADYTKLPKSQQGAAPPPALNGNGTPNGTNMPFKPVPPPKPKNYRPPVQGQWENAEPSSPRSPNGFYYPPTPSHYHHSQASVSNGNGPSQPPMTQYGSSHYNTVQQLPQQPPPQHGYPPTNGFNGNGHQYSGGQQYVQRGHPPPIGNLPPDRHALDLAGSREQRGSAFELYRKPQIGATGHHHNMSEMEPTYDERYGNYYNYSPQQQQQQHHHQQMYYQQQNDPNYNHFYATNGGPPPLPMKNTFPKVKKKSVLKSPLTALKNAIIKSTRPLRRMNSMVEPEKKLKPCLRRQHSLMERNIGHLEYPQEDYNTYPRQPPHPQYNYNQRNDQFYNTEMNRTYTNMEPENIYGTNGRRREVQRNYENDDLYSNRASIDLERRQAEMGKQSGKRIVRRHSLADRVGSRRQQFVQNHPQDDIYQSRQGAFMMEQRRHPNSEVMARRRFYSEEVEPIPVPDEPIYQSRREMHRSHLYQSRKEMQERIAAGKKEIETEFSPQSSSQSEKDDKSDRDSIYQSRREIKESGLKSRSQFREQIYQTRRDAMESMAEPIYVSKRDMSGRPEPIYESKEETVLSSKQNETDENKETTPNVNNCSSAEETLSNSKHSNDTMIETTVIAAKAETTAAVIHESPEEKVEEPETSVEEENETVLPMPPIEETALSPRAMRAPFHLSNIIKRNNAVPPPIPVAASRTSLETNYTPYTSQASLAVGPPNATSTPYASDMSLPLAGPLVSQPPPPQVKPLKLPSFPSEPTTTNGVFDEKGGTLCDKVWNVSLQIPAGAIPPGVKQEIYFTVSDPRIGQNAVGAPPLDIENGETMLSPLVMCGPQGLEFAVPVTLNIPHCAGRTASLGLALKATDSEKNLHTEWDNIDLPSNAAHTVSVKVDHF